MSIVKSSGSALPTPAAHKHRPKMAIAATASENGSLGCVGRADGHGTEQGWVAGAGAILGQIVPGLIVLCQP